MARTTEKSRPEGREPIVGSGVGTADASSSQRRHRLLRERWRHVADLAAAAAGMAGAVVGRGRGGPGHLVAASSGLTAAEVEGLLPLAGRLAGEAAHCIPDVSKAGNPLGPQLMACGFCGYAAAPIVPPESAPFGTIVAVDRQGGSDAVRAVAVLQSAARIMQDELAMVNALDYGESTIRRLGKELADLDMARVLADRESAAKSSFLAAMSHELRTPLNAIIGFSEVLKDQIFGPMGRADYVEYAADIHESGRHLLSLINDVLDMSKIEANRMQIEPEWLELEAVLRTGVKLVALQARKRRVSIAFAVEEPKIKVHADERALKQILFNLLSNAVKYTEENGSVTVGGRRSTDGGTSVIVADTGIGIAADDLNRLLRPFERANNRIDLTHQGFGLGLALVNNLIQLHGGGLHIDSAVGVGTTVTVTFPNTSAAHPPSG